ncbi:MAG: zinc ribbon domain-containing protein [Methanobrevibacter sp.]|uniref:zinc ribbon domain-containing protein n=1 Tax=Methanobrevibacter sp. TaxID=66852 RepID=UPI0025D69D87|nr:zinc ribbon domain-containing protein [Methanobrevibacter sp.]MBR0271396.1 zinc ribbon domain-containing protein [Methanobrevibacter sp.]
MSKTCPNCGVNSPDNAKHCIECGENIEDVPINKQEKPKAEKPSDNTVSNLGCIIMIAAVVILIVAAGFFIFNSGDNEVTEKNITITFDEVYVHDYTSSGKLYYSYYVSGFINNFPDDMNGYMIKTIYYDANDNEVTSTTNKLSYYDYYKDSDYPATISSYVTQNYVDVDHVTVQIIKDGDVLDEFTSAMNTNKLTSVHSASYNLTNNT